MFTTTAHLAFLFFRNAEVEGSIPPAGFMEVLEITAFAASGFQQI